MTTASATLLDAARAYLRRGLSIIPVCRPTPDGCSAVWHRHDPEDAGKRPLVKWEPYQLEAPHADQADQWWGESDANVAIVTGAVSGLVVLDADGPEGIAALDTLGVPRHTWIARTGRGLHIYLRHPRGDVRIGNRARIRPKLDVRGDGGYVLAPPSLHRSGRAYEWATAPDDVELAEIPPPVFELLVAPVVPPSTSGGAGAEIPTGRRNDALYRLGRALIAKGMTAAGVIAALLEENRARCRPPLSEPEVRAIAEHVTTQPDRAEFAQRNGHVGAVPGLGLVAIGELLGEPPESYAWVVEGRLPAAGLGLVAGKPKAGKSTLVRALALAVARGVPWLGFPTTAGPVIYLALEEKRAEVREHFRAMGARADDQILVLCTAAPLDALERLRHEALWRHPVLIIIDPLFRFVRVDDGNDYATMSTALEPLMTLARETGAHVLLVHHLGKGTDHADAGDSVLGSTAIFGAVDVALLMKRTERYRTLSSIQRYGQDLDETTLTLDPETRNVGAGVTRAAAELDDAARRIVEYFAAHPAPVTEAELDGSIECRRQAWKRALRDLVAGGRIARTGRGGKSDPFRYGTTPELPGVEVVR